MKRPNVDEYHVVAYLPYGVQRWPGFALPLLANSAFGNQRFVQAVDEITNTITGFLRLEGMMGDVTALGDQQVSCKLGSPAVFVFVAEDATPHVGTLDQLAALLRDLVQRGATHAGVRLQVMELIGTEPERRTARTQVWGGMLQNSGPATARRFIEGSALRLALWRRLLEAAPSDAAARRILRCRSQLEITIEQNGTLSIDLAPLTRDDYAGLDPAILAEELRTEFGIELRGSEVSRDTSGAGRTSREVEGTVGRIRATARHEERIAMLLKQLVEDTKTGLAILDTYWTDRAKSAKLAIQEIRLTFRRRMPSNPDEAEFVVSALIPRLFSLQFPLNRGAMLFYLAKHLGEYRHINRALRIILERSGKTFTYQQWADDAREALVRGERRNTQSLIERKL